MIKLVSQTHSDTRSVLFARTDTHNNTMTYYRTKQTAIASLFYPVLWEASALLLATFYVVSGEEGVCSVCGVGLQVGNPDGVFEYKAGQQQHHPAAISCGMLELAGKKNSLPVLGMMCSDYPILTAEICDCRQVANSTTESVAEDAATLAKSTLAAPAQAPAVSAPCSVCGAGHRIGNPDAIFSFPGVSSNLTCGSLEKAGEDGLISVLDCLYLPSLLVDECQCRLIECNVCDEPGYSIANPSGIIRAEIVNDVNGAVDTPNEFVGLRCDEIESQAERGLINETTCEAIPVLIDEYCGGCTTTLPPNSRPTSQPYTPTEGNAADGDYEEVDEKAVEEKLSILALLAILVFIFLALGGPLFIFYIRSRRMHSPDARRRRREIRQQAAASIARTSEMKK